MALTALRIAKLTRPGRYADGAGLWLQVSQSDPAKAATRAWLFRFRSGLTKGGKPRIREMGLGPLADVSLSQARDLRDAARAQVRAGIDPIAARKAAREAAAVADATATTFKQAALAALTARESGWDNAEHARQWKRSLEVYAFPTLGNLPVGAVTTPAILKCLTPIWTTKRVTAERVRGRIEAVLDWASASGARSGDNPARWRGHLEHLLASTPAAVVHMPALPYPEVPAFMARVRVREGITARALEFTILTTTRTGETLGARWDEIDGYTWTVPAERMKGTKDQRREHRVPLSKAARALLDALPRINDFVFPGRGDGPLHPKAMGEMLRAMKVGATVHGFRSSFKDWASESTGYANEISEMALAHRIPSKVERSYRRGDMFDKRARLMEDWAKFCGSDATDKLADASVTPIRGRRHG
jgi:integrase